MSTTRPRWHVEIVDCITFLRTIADASVDLVCTDYAYESLEKHRAHGTTTRLKQSDASSNEWFEVFRNNRVPELMVELHRVMKKDAHAYFLSDQETMMKVVEPMGTAAGFHFWKFLVWVKTKGVDTGEVLDLERDLHPDKVAIGMGYHWRSSMEVISFLEKGKRKLNNLGWPDVLPAPRIRNGYPTEKPVSLLRTLIENSTEPGDVVLDPFGGSWSCGEAALRSGRNFLGCDIKPSRLEPQALARLAAHGYPDAGLLPRRTPPKQGGLFG